MRKPPARPAVAPSAGGYYDLTHRPLQCLVFLLPLVAAYEVGMALVHQWSSGPQRHDLAAQLLLQWLFSLFGASGYYLPGLALVAVLLAWHVASRQPWSIDGVALGGMLAESVLFAIPLLAMNQFVRQRSLAAFGEPSVAVDLLLSIGAGIYEELVFRLIVISFLMMLLKDIGGMRQTAAVALTVIASSLAFAAHHYAPIGSDVFSVGDFAFRAAAGAYLAGVFVFRGFGIAVGSHVMYDVIVVFI
ncbi:MAG: CPBP family glutamic-type intramembrane protease [Phycisphaerae bacterium]|nr:CPBP family glutamic-type intramembrane protease [Phycisphaerae bacterium]